MLGQMMHRPLMIADILEHAALVHGDEGIITSTVEGGIHRQTYVETAARTRQLARALKALGMEEADRVATLAWNTHRHVELYYAISGIGSVCHTINPRLSAEQFIYIVNHAQDRLIFTDLTFVPLIEGLRAQLPDDLRVVVMTDRAHMPESALELLCYEELLAAESDAPYDWPEFPEETASSLCYTSGTTGNPKGALYSHRSTVLHAMMSCTTPLASLRPGKRLLPVVPLFHVNAWGTPYSAPLVGATMVMPGPHLDGPSLFKLMDEEKVDSSWGVPTVWLGLLAEIAHQGRTPGILNEVVVGGSAAPRKMIEDFEMKGISVCHAWGMTEMSPIGTQGLLTGPLAELPFAERMDLKQMQGRPIFGVELKLIGEDGTRQPKDGVAEGELLVRGNSIISGYFNDEEASAKAFDPEGWFATGDVAKIAPNGFLTITDRAKDLIKSGGEWISSIDVENMAMSHPKVANCAVIAVPHPKWDERPLLVVVPAGEDKPTRSELIEHLAEHLAKWQLPDDVVFRDDLPLTATGKVSKLTLRKEYAEHKLPSAGD